MRLDLGCQVRCTDDAFGELTDVVIGPTTGSEDQIGHVVLEHGPCWAGARS